MATELTTTDGGTVTVSPELLQSFKAGFGGPVYGPDDAEYEETRKKARIDKRDNSEAAVFLRVYHPGDLLP